jgi:hypothetical protein
MESSDIAVRRAGASVLSVLVVVVKFIEDESES